MHRLISTVALSLSHTARNPAKLDFAIEHLLLRVGTMLRPIEQQKETIPQGYELLQSSETCFTGMNPARYVPAETRKMREDRGSQRVPLRGRWPLAMLAASQMQAYRCFVGEDDLRLATDSRSSVGHR
jgi:hypothetical protein